MTIQEKTKLLKASVLKRRLIRIQVIPKKTHKALHELDAYLDEIKEEIKSALAGNKVSCQRIRTKSIKLRDDFKAFRKLSIVESKKK